MSWFRHIKTKADEIPKARSLWDSELFPPVRRTHPRVFLVHGVAYPWRMTREDRKADEVMWMEPLADYLREHWNAAMRTFYWDGTTNSIVHPSTRDECYEALIDFFGDDLENRRDCVIIAKSGGAMVVDNVLRHYPNLVRLGFGTEIRIASPIHSCRASMAAFETRILLVSRRDHLYQIARAALFPIRLFYEHHDPAQRIVEFDTMAHGDFNVDRLISMQGIAMRLFELYGRCIRDGFFMNKNGGK